jgi:UrcA family protein
MIKFTIFCLAALAAMPVVAAHASSPTAPTRNGSPTAIIAVRDLDLGSHTGQRKFRQRIATAVEAVCGSYANATVEDQDDIAACRRAAIADISPRVTAMIARFAPSAIAVAAL